MVKPLSPRVNGTQPAVLRLLLIRQAVIWGLLGGAAWLVFATGADTWLAQQVYNPQSGWAWQLRQHGTKPAVALAVAGLLGLLWPGLCRKAPEVYRTAVVVVLTTLLGAGLISQVLVQDAADRPRPRESVLAPADYTPPAEFRGNSMPSGHAAMAFVLAAPFFALRRRRPRAAWVFLGTGVTAGLLVGASRMVLGAHFASDVLVAGAITLSAASVFEAVAERLMPVPRWVLAAAAVAAGLGLALGNRFTTDLTLELKEPFKHIEVPCTVTAMPTPGLGTPTLHVTLKGYGTPLSQLQLYYTADNVVRIQTHKGLYHSLSCTARLNTPAE